MRFTRLIRPILFLAAAAGTAHGAEPSFTRDVLPILSAKCFPCHGPDAEHRKASLRLDDGVDIFARHESGTPVIGGNRADSVLYRKITSGDAEQRMPPPSFPKQLSLGEIDTLRRWIDAGAKWEGHWAFQPLKHVTPPQVKDTARLRNPIDNFIQAALEARGLTPMPEADARTLIRRLTFDLHGLPPTPEEIDAFVNDPSPFAYDKLVERLLASPRYGERWTRHWLDVAHYGETHGYDKDKRRPNAWPYRDYVIRSLNEDKPYGRFAAEQIAGDVLYPDDPQATVALGFVAAGPWDFVGHVELREGTVDKAITRNLDRDDMVTNAMGTFVSLTVQCARCHDHKFDPISQADYYSLQAVFAGVDRAERPYDDDPAVHAKRAGLMHEQAVLRAKKNALDERMKTYTSAELTAIDVKLKPLRDEAAKLDAVTSPSNGYHSGIEAKDDVTKWVQVDLGAVLPIESIRLIPASPTDFVETPRFGFPQRFRVEVSNDAGFTAPTSIADYTAADFKGRTDDPLKLDAHGAAARYVRVTATRLWKRTNDYVFALAELQVNSGGKNVALGKSVTALDSIDSGRWHTKYLVDGYGSRVRLEDAATPEGAKNALASVKAQIAALERERDAETRKALNESERLEYIKINLGLGRIEHNLKQLPKPKMVYAAAADFTPEGSCTPAGAPREIHVLKRGDIKSLGDLVRPGAVGCLPKLEAHFKLPEHYGESEARAALALWIAHQDNVLTWRSIVNRVWQYHFGKGLVETPNDFGRMGAAPTHPELLDWLAFELLEHSQSLKWLHRMIVHSATYRQQSAEFTGNARIDAGNQYLWRMNRRQLDAEALRDAVLAVSGKLDLTMGGPSFDEYAFEDDHSPRYLYDKHDPTDAKAFRRAIYRSIVRSVPDPLMTTLDCADPSQAVPVRTQTITALQALAMFNNPMITQQSKYFAERVAKASENFDVELKTAYKIALGRIPNEREMKIISDYANRYGLPAACRVILNSNEFLFVD